MRYILFQDMEGGSTHIRLLFWRSHPLSISRRNAYNACRKKYFFKITYNVSHKWFCRFFVSVKKEKNLFEALLCVRGDKLKVFILGHSLKDNGFSSACYKNSKKEMIR